MDDKDLLRSVVARMLEIMGYDVVTAAEGEEALRLYREAAQAGYPFDAVILDLVVEKGMGGREAMLRLRELDPDAVVLISSGYPADPVMRNYREYGFSGVVPKPYSSEELREALSSVLKPGGDAQD